MVRAYQRQTIYATHCLTGGEPRVSLLAPKYRRQGQGHFLYGTDSALGDDQYVFLYVEDIYEPGTDCYLFDAEQLVREGALVRKFDVSQYPGLESDWMALNNYGRTRADILEAADRIPEVAEALSDLEDARDEITLKGEEAIQFLRHPERWSPNTPPEILVPKRLPLYKSIGLYPGVYPIG